MCLIVETNSTKEISKNLLQEFSRRNNDGYGFMWIEKNKIHTYKTEVTKLDELEETYQKLKQFNPIIHFRMKTHGLVNHDNTHPYYVGWGIYLMHNGVMHDFSKETEVVSDTQNFISNFLKPLLHQTKNPHKAIRNSSVLFAIEKLIGTGNKLVIGDRGGFIFVNKSSWHTITNKNTGMEGCIVSNTYAWDTNFGYPKAPFSPAHNYYGYYQGGQGYFYNRDYEDDMDNKATTPKIVTLPSKLIKQTNNFQNKFGFLPWKNNLYYDGDKLEVWSKRKNVWTRRMDLDDKLKEDLKQIELPLDDYEEELIGVKEVVEETETKASDLNLSQEEYENFLVKQWSNFTADELCNAVYSDPDEAAIVIHRLVHYEGLGVA